MGDLSEFITVNDVPHSAAIREEDSDKWIPYSQIASGRGADNVAGSQSYCVSLSIHFRMFLTFAILSIATTIWAYGQLGSWAISSAIFLNGNLSNMFGPILLAIASTITAYLFAIRILKLHALLITPHISQGDPFTWSFFKIAELAHRTNEISKEHLKKEQVINPVLARMFLVFGPCSFIPFIGQYFILTFLLIMPALIAQFFLASRTLATRLP